MLPSTTLMPQLYGICIYICDDDNSLICETVTLPYSMKIWFYSQRNYERVKLYLLTFEVLNNVARLYLFSACRRRRYTTLLLILFYFFQVNYYYYWLVFSLVLQPCFFFLSLFVKSPWVYWRIVKYGGAQQDELLSSLRNPTGSSTWRLGGLLTARYVYVPLQKKEYFFEIGDPICFGFLFLFIINLIVQMKWLVSLQEKSSVLIDGIDKEARNAQNECWNHNFFLYIQIN